MGSPRVVVIVNPRSQGGALGRRWSELADTIRRALPFEVARTEGPGDATRLAAQALRAGAEVVVAVGGDGTINEVANGFFADGQPVAPGAALAILPFGTGGDFVRTARIPKDWAAAVEVLARGARRTIDVGRLDHATRDGGPGVRMFVNIASFGLSGVTDRFVNQGQKRLGGKLSFFAATTRALLAYDNQRVHLVFDEQPADAVDMTINTVAVANGRYFGGGMMVAPDADVSDGLFDVTIWSGYGLADFVLKSGGIYSGAHVKWKGTRTLRCRDVKADSQERVLIDCDGEQPGRLPCRMTILPGAIRLKV